MHAAEGGGAPTGAAAVELKSVSKSFGSVSVIKGVDLTIAKGEFGPSTSRPGAELPWFFKAMHSIRT